MDNPTEQIIKIVEDIFTKLEVDNIEGKTARELIDTHTQEYLELRFTQVLTPEEELKLRDLMSLDINSMVSNLEPPLRVKVEKILDEVYIIYLPNVVNNLALLLNKTDQDQVVEKVKLLIK